MIRVILFLGLLIFLFSCGISGFGFFKTIRNKSYCLDSIVKYENGIRSYRYDSLRRTHIKSEVIYFGENEVLTEHVYCYNSITDLKDTSTVYSVKKIEYGVYGDSLRMWHNFSEHSFLFLMKQDSSGMELRYYRLPVEERRYYSRIE